MSLKCVKWWKKEEQEQVNQSMSLKCVKQWKKERRARTSKSKYVIEMC